MRLHINIDHVATLRNARGTEYPDPIRAARECLAAGAHGITAHLREDRRHIKDEDVRRLRAELAGTSLFNLEMAATDEMVGIAVATKPEVVTLVPERREERTTEGGLEVVKAAPTLKAHIDALKNAGIKVSLFIAPDLDQVRASHAMGVEQIELHTGEYAHDAGDLKRLAEAAKLGHSLGVEVAAGHGLTTENVPTLVAIPEIVELNIGHAVVADAIFMGIGGAVKAMLAAIKKGRP
jgi:pyridoxine 5-phosphate synthase